MTTLDEVAIDVGDGHVVRGDLARPDDTTGLVVFAHGSGSSRRSARNRSVAGHLRGLGLTTLLMDLLTEEEERLEAAGARVRFDVDLLAARVIGAIDWVMADRSLSGLPIGFFGASTGAAGAVVAAVARPEAVKTVVSRGGRPDLAGAALDVLTVPTLLVVGEADVEVLALNERAAARIGRLARLEVIPGATHLFEEPGALDAVATLAGRWFSLYLRAATA